MDWIQINKENKENLLEGTHHILVPVETKTGYQYWDIITGYVDHAGDIVTQSGDMDTGWRIEQALYYKPVGDLPKIE